MIDQLRSLSELAKLLSCKHKHLRDRLESITPLVMSVVADKIFFFSGVKMISLFLIAITLATAVAEVKEGSVVFREGEFHFIKSIEKNAIAYGRYNDTMLETGWGVLDIKTTQKVQKYNGGQVMFAVGMLEGVLTAQRIQQQYANDYPHFFKADLKDKICSFFSKNEMWTKMKVKTEKRNPFWKAIGYSQAQLEGLFAGYKLTGLKEISWCTFQGINALGDTSELVEIMEGETTRYPNYKKLLFSKTNGRRRSKRGHCSALVKITPGFENIYMGHSTWFIYSNMIRIYKHYDFQYFSDNPGSKMSFSSYPGVLCSQDDFYVLGSKMIILQTSLDVQNVSLYSLVTPNSLLAWQRVRAANFLANDGKEWGDYMKIHNSGTYNNQYMVVDLKKFEPGKAVHNGCLYVVEQAPGLVVSGDQTAILKEGYWASYNTPFYDEIAKVTGDDVDELCPRAKIFRRDQSKVVDLRSMKALMRSDDYKHDPYSPDPCSAICCRGDIPDREYEMNGCYDTKVTDAFLALKMMSSAISGPTYGGASDIPPFKWDSKDKDGHTGQPDVFNFPFIFMSPSHF